MVRSSRLEVFCKKSVLKNFTKFTGKHPCQSLLFNKVAGLRPKTLLKKKTLAQTLFCKFCEIFQITYFYRTLLVAASIWSSSSKVIFKYTNNVLKKKFFEYLVLLYFYCRVCTICSYGSISQ